MKLDSVKVFVVGNPPPGFGGRYFVFLKLRPSAVSRGRRGYAATFGPKVIAAMIEDLFARRFAGRDPFQIESIWREAYGSGFSCAPIVPDGGSQRPRDGLLGHRRQGRGAAGLQPAGRQAQ